MQTTNQRQYTRSHQIVGVIGGMLTAIVGNNTYLKQTTSNSLSTGMNGAWVSCRSALCMIDFNHLRMSTSHSSQLGHFVVLPSRHVSAGESPHSSTGGDLRSPSPVLIPILLPPLAEESPHLPSFAICFC